MTKVLRATWQRCRVHFARNALAHAGKTQRRIVSAWIGTAYAQDDAASAHAQWRTVADQLRPKVPKLAALMDSAEDDVLAYMDFPAAHRAKLHSTDEIDKTFACSMAYPSAARVTAWQRAGPEDASPAAPPPIVAPRWRHPCAPCRVRAVASARRTARRPVRPVGRPLSPGHAIP